LILLYGTGHTIFDELEKMSDDIRINISIDEILDSVYDIPKAVYFLFSGQ
jgi:hypothetical protein